MKKFIGASLILSLCSAIAMPIFAQKTEVASAATTPTGYTKASDVNYVKSGSYIANWGARDEDCVFLSSYATNFYTGSYSYDQMSLNAGGSSTSTAPTSALYKALQSMMKEEQTYETSYNATRDKFRYTDCVSSNYSNISSFYSGEVLSGAWDGGSTWNREHTWPNSKGDASGNGENDIMMLRPTSVKENSSRGNKAYGESATYYDPNQHGQNVRGDCARIMLFVYTRWGNTGSMWGSSGVMESLNILLKWMEEDPVDTWEMGRNDAVQSITGTRNVFVDYPEYAWMLFGKSVPTDMVTPSGKASGGVTVPDNPNPPVIPDTPTTPTEILDAAYGLATGETLDGTYELTGKIISMEEWNAQYSDVNLTIEIDGEPNRPVYCYGLKGATEGQLAVGDTVTVSGTLKNYKGTVEFDKPQLVEHISGTPTPPAVEECTHSYGEWTVVTPATTETEGLQMRTCYYCGHEETETIPKLEAIECNHRYGEWTVVTPATATEEGLQMHACRYCGYEETEVIPVLCNHRYGEWTVVTPATAEAEGLQKHACRYCGHEETEVIPQLEGTPTPDGSEINSDADSVSDSETDSSDDSVNNIIGGADSAIGSMTAGCQAVVGLPMLGMAVLMLGGALLKRKNDNE